MNANEKCRPANVGDAAYEGRVVMCLDHTDTQRRCFEHYLEQLGAERGVKNFTNDDLTDTDYHDKMCAPGTEGHLCELHWRAVELCCALMKQE